MLFKIARTALYVSLVLAVIGIGRHALAAQDSVFTIQGIEVDITADNAATARDQALTKAQQTAFQRLAERLLPEGNAEGFTPPETAVISSMINDFEITEEKLSSVRYIGTYTFRFNGDAVRNYMSGGGYAYTDVGSKPVMVLPFYQWGSKTILWDENNPWLTTWQEKVPAQGLVPLIVPIGDAQDVSDINDNEALTYNPSHLERMADRYGAGDTIIALAAPSWTNGNTTQTAPDVLNIMLYRTTDMGPQYTDNIKVTTKNDDTQNSLFGRAAKKVRTLLQSDWKSRTMVSPEHDNSLRARISFSSMMEWAETQKALRRVQGIKNVKLLSLTPAEAQIELNFQGDERRLRLALAQRDITLSTPQINFNDFYQRVNQTAHNSYGSPLTYDLYLNKFRQDRPY